MRAILLSLATFFSTLVGGLFGLRYRDHLNLMMGFTAGVLVGLVSFDQLPEIFRLVYALHLDSTGPMLALMGGFLLFHMVEKSILIHFSHEEQYAVHQHPLVGILSAIALTGHSFLDGVGIGLGFQVSAAVGLVASIAVISHDFSDGLNTVTLMIVNKNTSRRSFLLLLADAGAPVAGPSPLCSSGFPSLVCRITWASLLAFCSILEQAISCRRHTATGVPLSPSPSPCWVSFSPLSSRASSEKFGTPVFTTRPTLFFTLRVYAMQRLRLWTAVRFVQTCTLNISSL